jgi:hypothetical protein
MAVTVHTHSDTVVMSGQVCYIIVNALRDEGARRE